MTETINNNLLSIKQVAQILGVSIKTIRRWEQNGKIRSIRTPGGHRRFYAEDFVSHSSEPKLTIGYARINSHQSLETLNQQISGLNKYAREQGWNIKIIQDIGNGINNTKPGLNELLRLITSQKIKRLVLTHQDRLLRLGADLVFTLCTIFQVEVIITNQLQEGELEEDLSEDIEAIVITLTNSLPGLYCVDNTDLINKFQKLITLEKIDIKDIFLRLSNHSKTEIINFSNSHQEECSCP